MQKTNINENFTSENVSTPISDISDTSNMIYTSDMEV